MGSGPRPPRATYRLQLRGPDGTGPGLREAAESVPYLARLGISHLYLSPVLRAAAGSTHGYDVVDPRTLDPALGDEADWAALVARLREHGMGLVLDIVPNHLAITGDNPFWWEVLENGRAARSARLFDVEWEHFEPALRDSILVPILGDHYGRVLEAGELRLVREGGAFVITWHEHRLPVALRSLDELLRDAAAAAGSDTLALLADAAGALPPASTREPDQVDRLHRDRRVLRDLLDRLLRDEPDIADAVDAQVDARNAEPDALDRILERQAYRLAYWRAAGRDLGYRRFFDVTTLAGIRVEDPWVFHETHGQILRWVADGDVDGLRIDHPDGLLDPAGYLDRLAREAPDAWIVVEKILEPGERLRPWPVAGTTGYDALQRIDGLFVDPEGEAPLREAFAAITGETRSFAAIAREARLEVLREALGSELNRITALGLQVLERHRRHRDHTRHDVHEALRELAAGMPVYRTYVRPEAGVVDLSDTDAINEALRAAREAREDLPADLLELLRDILTLRLRGELEGELALRFQQLTGAVMAKGVEDTAFYRYVPLLSLNEVGGDPQHFGVTLEAFHESSRLAAERWPNTMVAGSTHDTKRDEDARARLHVLAHHPERWLETVESLRLAGAPHRRGELPDAHAGWVLWQLLAAAWPIDAGRLETVLVKSLREAKLRTSWARIDAAYERDVVGYARDVLEDPAVTAILAAHRERTEPAARVVTLAMLLLRLTVPGVPDIYQGTELPGYRLVDPDNRARVDLAARSALLDKTAELGPEAVLERWDAGVPKLWLMARVLGVRAMHPDVFATGSHTPLIAEGPGADRVVAYLRGERIATVVPRLVDGPDERPEASLTLPPGSWRDALTGEEHVGGASLEAAVLLGRFPVALLVRQDES